MLRKSDADWNEDLQERIDRYKYNLFDDYVGKLEFAIALENRWLSELLPYQWQRWLVK